MADNYSEASLEHYFHDSVLRAGGFSLKLAPTQAGVPDRLVVFPGNDVWFIELKTETGSLSPIQREWWENTAMRYSIKGRVLYGKGDIDEFIRDRASFQQSP